MRLFKKSIILILILFSFNSFGVGREANAPKTSSQGWIKEQINIQNNIIKETTQKINSLEKNLSVGNKRYLRTVKKRKELETLVYDLGKKSEDLDFQLKNKLNEISKNVRGILVNSFGKQDTPSELLAKKILINQLKEDQRNYQTLTHENNMMAGKLKSLSDRLEEYKSIESELTSVLQNLEYKKRDNTSRYYSTVRSKDELESKLARIKFSKPVNKTENFINKGIFKSPLSKFISLDYKKKGVTYKYKGKRAIRSTGDGKVVYKGTLSNFGNVIMIDHGKQTRTVLLGNFDSRIEKGMAVKAGQLLGHTRETGLKEAKLYFEVRKKNKVQNTIQFIDRNSLAKNQQSNDNI